MLAAPEVVVWTDAEHAPLVGQLLGVMGNRLRTIGIGGDGDARLQRLGDELACPVYNDLRKLLVDRPAAWLWAATRTPAPLADLGNAAESTRLITLEPLSASLDAIATANEHRVAHATLAPAFLDAPGFRLAADPQEHLGTPRLLQFSSFGQRHEGSLFARMFDAWRAILAFTDLPETITASITEPAESLRNIAGHCTVQARLPEGCVGLSLSDRSGWTGRHLTAVGTEASLSVTDCDFRLTPLDTPTPDADGNSSAESPPSFVDLIADQWCRLLDRPASAVSTEAHTATMACCAACLLSARTAQPESPGKLRELHR